MRQHRNTSILCTLALLLAACGGTNSSGGTGANLTPAAGANLDSGKALSTAAYVSSSESLTLTASDPDGSVAKLKWVIDAGQPLERSSEYKGSNIKASIPLVLPKLNSGLHSLTLTVTDDQGATDTSVTTFKVDAVAPTISSVAVNEAALTEGQALSFASTDAVSLKVAGSDSRGGGDASASTTSIEIYVADVLVKSGPAPLAYDLTSVLSSATTPQPIRIVALDSVLNSTTRTFTLQAASTTTIPVAPSPVLVINNAETSPYSNIVSVTVSGGIAAGVAASQVILEITDANGLVDSTSYVSKNTSATFSIDTTKYPDGQLSLRAVAIDANNLIGKSVVRQIQIRNLVPPSMDLINPTAGSTVNGSILAKVQLRRNNTAFTFPNNIVTFDVLDYRGQILRTLPATITEPNPGVYEASATFDINGPQFPNNIYTIQASTSVLLNGEGTTRKLQAVSQFTTKNVNNKPPALIIQMPARPDTYDLAQKKFPVLNRNSGVMVQISDDNLITNVQMQLTCDSSIKLASQTCPASEYQINFPVNKTGLLYRVFNIGTMLDGEPYVENGNYILRFTVSDGTNTNIQEIPVTIDRARNSVAGLTYSSTAIDPNTCPSALNVDSYLTVLGSASFSRAGTTCDIPGSYNPVFDRVTNPVRVVELEYNSNSEGLSLELPSLIGISPELPSGSVIQGGEAPEVAGTYRTSFIVEDLVTGVVTMYQGGNVGVKKNP